MTLKISLCLPLVTMASLAVAIRLCSYTLLHAMNFENSLWITWTRQGLHHYSAEWAYTQKLTQSHLQVHGIYQSFDSFIRDAWVSCYHDYSDSFYFTKCDRVAPWVLPPLPKCPRTHHEPLSSAAFYCPLPRHKRQKKECSCLPKPIPLKTALLHCHSLCDKAVSWAWLSQTNVFSSSCQSRRTLPVPVVELQGKHPL